MKKTLFATLGLGAALAFAGSAYAATHTYYVAQSAKTHKCEVTSHKPDGKTWTMIGTDSYKTKTDATKAMGADAACKA